MAFEVVILTNDFAVADVYEIYSVTWFEFSRHVSRLNIGIAAYKKQSHTIEEAREGTRFIILNHIHLMSTLALNADEWIERQRNTYFSANLSTEF